MYGVAIVRSWDPGVDGLRCSGAAGGFVCLSGACVFCVALLLKANTSVAHPGPIFTRYGIARYLTLHPARIGKKSDFPCFGQAFLREVRPRLGHGHFLTSSRETFGGFLGPIWKRKGLFCFVFLVSPRSVNDSGFFRVCLTRPRRKCVWGSSFSLKSVLIYCAGCNPTKGGWVASTSPDRRRQRRFTRKKYSRHIETRSDFEFLVPLQMLRVSASSGAEVDTSTTKNESFAFRSHLVHTSFTPLIETRKIETCNCAPILHTSPQACKG